MIHIVDAPTGQGKTNAAINYMNSHDERFLFVTPYKTELERIIKSCPEKKFCQPEAIYETNSRVVTKKNGIKKLFRSRKNIVTTHALFRLFDNDMIEFCKKYKYTLILDEVTDVADVYEELKADDLRVLLKHFVTVDNCLLKWREDKTGYNGNKFLREKGLCEMRCLYLYGDTTMLWQFSIDIFKAFENSFVLTYMFNGQLQKYYYDFHELKYDRWYVRGNSLETYELTTERQSYGNPSQYKPLIEILDNPKLNAVGDDYYALSSNWYDNEENHFKIEQVRKNLTNYYKHYVKGGSDACLWTCFNSNEKDLKGDGYAKGRIACNAKATNQYRDKKNLAYVVNSFINPNIKNFFEGNGIPVDGDAYALSSLIQWVWRSAIRDGKPIKLYLPSSRMRNLFISWLNDEVDIEWETEQNAIYTLA